MSPLLIGVVVLVVVVYVMAWALCRAAALGDRRVDSGDER